MIDMAELRVKFLMLKMEVKLCSCTILQLSVETVRESVAKDF